MTRQLRVLFTKGFGLEWHDWSEADTVLQYTDVPEVYKVLKSRYRADKVGKLIHIKEF